MFQTFLNLSMWIPLCWNTCLKVGYAKSSHAMIWLKNFKNNQIVINLKTIQSQLFFQKFFHPIALSPLENYGSSKVSKVCFFELKNALFYSAESEREILVKCISSIICIFPHDFLSWKENSRFRSCWKSLSLSLLARIIHFADDDLKFRQKALLLLALTH